MLTLILIFNNLHHTLNYTYIFKELQMQIPKQKPYYNTNIFNDQNQKKCSVFKVSLMSHLKFFMCESLIIFFLFLQVSYAIGVAHPLSISIFHYGTSQKTEKELLEIVKKNFDLRPGVIVRYGVVTSFRGFFLLTNKPLHSWLYIFHLCF